jgi:hypothetical protein
MEEINELLKINGRVDSAARPQAQATTVYQVLVLYLTFLMKWPISTKQVIFWNYGTLSPIPILLLNSIKSVKLSSVSSIPLDFLLPFLFRRFVAQLTQLMS